MLRVTRRWGRRTLAAGAAACLVAAACSQVNPVRAGYAARVLTPDGNSVYRMSASGDVLQFTAAATNTSANMRVGFWRTADPASVDQQTCATWVSYGGKGRQQGAVLRARTSGGRTTAITVTNNILYGARWGFNIHVMDTAADQPYHQVAGFLLEDVFRPNGPGTTSVPPHPWRMCARAAGDVVSFIVWPLSDPQPAWGDPRYGGSVRLPAGWGLGGEPGWYIAHLQPGEVAGFTDLTTRRLSSTEVAAGAQAASDTFDAAAAPSSAPRDPTWIAVAP
jgi:hypothetical protein